MTLLQSLLSRQLSEWRKVYTREDLEGRPYVRAIGDAINSLLRALEVYYKRKETWDDQLHDVFK